MSPETKTPENPPMQLSQDDFDDLKRFITIDLVPPSDDSSAEQQRPRLDSDVISHLLSNYEPAQAAELILLGSALAASPDRSFTNKISAELLKSLSATEIGVVEPLIRTIQGTFTHDDRVDGVQRAKELHQTTELVLADIQPGGIADIDPAKLSVVLRAMQAGAGAVSGNPKLLSIGLDALGDMVTPAL